MNILCFGDSNTFGISPVDGKRLGDGERWPSILAELLGSEHLVIEAGLPNRTLVNNPPFSGYKSGVKYLKPYLEAQPLDVIIIALGTNDLKARFNLTPVQIAQSLNKLLLEIDNFYIKITPPKCIVISPPKVYEVNQYQHIYAGAEIKSQQLAAQFTDVAKLHQCHFLDAYSLVNPCPNEGIHLALASHNLLAEHLDSLLRNEKGFLINCKVDVD
ncbi:SGNH/GDSL hydrolase family protein [Pseudoalteromonas sp. KG3]|jgi:lysophospholipase L1-like esterase|uniref:SGNH/GDSL hydrolase family protein n=1 Tax=Pseudoalteromonas TaxID=53246 RepID=UPI00265A6C60|nr:SGNH/GDSL hydrolase family protein [Pseudoalteromonas sp. KG3]WKD25802.1 SGNH/GDSL hydrolase family protein [Pseudoalteromonas sp. KG3]